MSPEDRESKKQKCEEEFSLSSSCIKIDGSKGEGGGQILRNAIAYACILQKELFINQIRAGRSRPGLQAQHLTSLELAVAICGGTLHGSVLGSTQIHYQPREPGVNVAPSPNSSETVTGDTGTAGSICLLLQAALPCALLGNSLQSSTKTSLILKGGTNADMAPQYDYWELVLVPTLRQFVGIGLNQIQAQVKRRGYYPRGGGEVLVNVQHCDTPLQPIRMTDRGDVIEISVRSFHADVVTEAMAVGSGLGILVVAKTKTGCLLAGSSLCKPKQAAKEAGEAAAKELWDAISNGGCTDSWLQDQLILFMALADGESELLTGSLTLHTQTAIMVAREMTGVVFHVEKLSDDLTDSVPVVHHTTTGYGSVGEVSGKHLIRCFGSQRRRQTRGS